MTESLRSYLRLHRAGDGVLPAIRSFVREHGTAGPAEILELSRRVGLPAAAVRAVISYYADLHEDATAVRLCRGTSCVLGGSGAAWGSAAWADESLRGGAPAGTPRARPVYCVGYCDRSPAALMPDDSVRVRCHGFGPSGPEGEAPSSPPRIACAAREAIVTARIAAGDFSDLFRARECGVYSALERALGGPAAEVLAAVEASGERGRGGAAFPTGRKWRACAAAPADERFVVANGDEGDPGSYVDRVLMESDPHSILEGMLLCGYAVGAREGIVFIRSEYPAAIVRMQRAIEQARAAGLVGPSVAGTPFSFEVAVFPGMGSYVCGEETAMLNAIEGFRGDVRVRPPYPAVEGLFGRPTVVNNVETLVNVPWIVARGGEAYRRRGTPSTSGTIVTCLNHGFARPGIVEVEAGTLLREVIEGLGGGGRDGVRLEAIVLGGPMGSLLLPDEWDVPVCYGAMGDRGIQLGHGGIVALPEGTDFRLLLRHWLEFMASESCGRCVPCGIGSRRALETARRPDLAGARPVLERLFDVMEQGSLCAFGQLLPGPMRRMVEVFGDRIFGASA